jgi:hypothetical protein
MPTNYKGILLNNPGDPAPWGTVERDALTEIIDSVVIDTVSGSASDAKVNGHKHFKLYAESTGDLVLSIDATQKTTFVGDVQFDSDLVVPAATSPGFIKNDGTGTFTYGNPGESVPGGVDTNIQYNDSGSLGGSNRMSFRFGEELVMKNSGLSDTITLASETGSIITNNGVANTTLRADELSVEQNFKITPGNTDRAVFLDGFTNNSITGWYDPATLSVASITTFNINKAGIAFFIKKGTYPYTYVRLDVPVQNNIVANLGLSGREIHIFIDELGNVIQKDSVTSTDLLTLCYIGNLTKNSAGTEISFETNQGPVTDSIIETTRVFLLIIGGIQTINMFIRGAGLSNLQVSRTAGEVIRLGIESSIDRAEPDSILVAAENPIATLSYRYIDENDEPQFLSNRTDLDPTQWYNKSTTSLATVTSNNWSGQRVYYFAASAGGQATTIVLLGHAQFNTAADAKAAMGTADEEFSKPQFLKRAVFLGWIIARGGGTNADSMSDVEYLDFNDPFELSRTGSGSSSGGAATMQSTYNSSSIPQIITDATRGSVVYQRGSSSDVDNVFVVRNGAGNSRFQVQGDGDTTITDNAAVTLQVETLDAGSTPQITLKNDSVEFSHKIDGVNDTFRFRDEGTAKDRYYINTSGQQTFVGERTTFESDVTGSNYNLALKGQDATHGGAIIGLNSAGSDGPLEFYTGSNKRVSIDEVSGAVSVGPSDEVVIHPLTPRPANGLPSGNAVMSFQNWQLETDGSGNTLRLGKFSPLGTELMSFGTIGSGTVSRTVFNTNQFEITDGEIFQDVFEITPDFKSFRFKYDNNSAASGAPVDNGFRFNNADPLLATKLFVDYDPLDKPASVNYILDAIATGSKLYTYNSERTIQEWYDITIDTVTPQTGYVEYDITVNDGNTSGLVNGADHGLVFKEPAGGGGLTTAVASEFFVVPTGTQAMANGVTIVPNMNSETYDPDNVYDLSTDTFTAPANGLYVFTGSTKVSTSDGGQIESYLYVNGSLVTTASGSIDVAGTMVANVAMSIELSTNDTVQMRAAQFSGFSGTMQISETFLSGHRIL